MKTWLTGGAAAALLIGGVVATAAALAEPAPIDQATVDAAMDRLRERQRQAATQPATTRATSRPATAPAPLPETTRRRIWDAMIYAERRADDEAWRAYPATSGGGEATIVKRNDLFDQYEEEYEQEIARKYGVTREQLEEISMEAIKSGWPYPPTGEEE